MELQKKLNEVIKSSIQLIMKTNGLKNKVETGTKTLFNMDGALISNQVSTIHRKKLSLPLMQVFLF